MDDQYRYDAYLDTPLTGTQRHKGLFHGGGWYPLFVQSVAVLSISMWSSAFTFVLLSVCNVQN